MIISTQLKITSLVLLIVITISKVEGQTGLNVKEEIKRTLEQEGLTGAVWSVVNSKGEIAFDAVGLKNKETGEALTPTDKVHIGSITKTLLATGVLRLATEGKLDLNDPVEKYLPDMVFENKWGKTNTITIRHLLDHTSGLEDLRLWQMFSEKATPSSALQFTFQKNPSVLKIRTRPGSQFSYSNMGYTLVAMVIESVTKEGYESYLDKNLLQTIGMKNSTFGFVTQVGDKAEPNLAIGHLDNQVVFPALPIYLRPAGQFTTTAYDMAVFLRFLMSDGTLDGHEFINKALLKKMGKPDDTDALRNGLEIGYGLGIMQRDRHGYIGLAHSGNIVGYHAMIYIFTESQCAFFISHNMDSESANYERFNEILIKQLDLKKTEPKIKTIMPETLSDWDGYYTPVVSRFQPLAFIDVLTGFTKVSIKNDNVILAPFQKPTKILFPVSEQSFIADGKITTSHVFFKNDEKESFISDGFSTIRKTNILYLVLNWVSFFLGCLGLIYILVSGIIQIVKFRKQFITKPLAWAFITVMLLFIPIPFFLSQSFVSLGDLTIASVTLVISTAVLPLGLLFSIWVYFKSITIKFSDKIDLLAITLSMQFIVVLSIWGLIPFRLWV